MTQTADALIRAYYEAFNAGDEAAFLALLTDDVEHDISQGDKEVGKEAFSRFLAHMNNCYRERIELLRVMTESTGQFAASEFIVHGEYLKTDPGVPEGTAPARGQRYTLPAGAFFTIRDGKVARISNHYNLGEWIRQVNEG
ncbi:putative cytosolic protein [Granulibacter bethesdensis]|uniref:Cytosolic protein n=1 Tax=Granulibacter bethesdensis TaxID=364410 RepID=A0AAC9KDH4_9PROT|nr:ketosteroid isomerase-related protein [Granulibacter bethesdensis]APH55423.1 putative cytosolic protein [Granulibacter bethesdensis]APH63009.1 putative cytosolic protein [Granulibacter bethesdensis]